MPILLPLLAALIPLLTLPGVLFYFDITPKIAVLLLGVAIACCHWRRNGATLRAFAQTGGGRMAVAIFAAMALVLILSAVFSTNPWLSVSGSNWRRFGVVTQLGVLIFTLLAAAEVSTGRLPLRPTLGSVAASSIVISLYAIGQYFGWDPIQPSSAYHIGKGEWAIVRPPSTIGHANYLGTYLCFSVFLSAALLRMETGTLWRPIAAAAALCGILAIVLSGSRAAMAGVVAGAIVLLLMVRPRPRQAILGVAICGVLLTCFYFSPWGLKLRGRARWFREDSLGGARLLMGRDALKMFAARPLTGWGTETFSTAFPRFQSLELARSYPDFYHESPHNIFIDELTAKGLLGFAVFGLLCAVAVRAALRREKDLLLAAFAAALVNLLFTSLTVTSAFYFYWVAALLIAGISTDRFEPAKSYKLAWLGIPAGLLFAVCAMRLLVADYALQQTRNLIARNDPAAAAVSYATARAWQLPGTSSDLYYSRAIHPLFRRQTEIGIALKVWQEAVQAGIRATQFGEDRHNAYYSLANIYALMNMTAETERSLRGAIQAAPNWYKSHWMLARTLNLQGKREEARVEAQRAVDLGGAKHAEVLDTLRQLTAPR